MLEKLPELVRTQVEAVKNIKIDKITVWENGSGKDGKTSTSNFISGMYKAVPPLQEMFNMAGMQLPTYLKGEDSDAASTKTSSETSKPIPPETKR